MMDEPDPTPATLASHLIGARERAILIIDNCAPDLHRRVSDLCRSPESRVSLITVEYDIREDQPEGTEVFSLEPASIDLIDKLVRRRFPHLLAVGARTIAEFSGGNARIAIALAETIGKNEAIAGLSDGDLFTRLFQQRQGQSESLLLAAQALSLVYSFHGEDISEGDGAELFRLGAVIGKSPQEMYRSAAELQGRNLVQRRGAMRAVLPQAIANRLAATALENIPSSEIQRFISGAPERLLKSFSRRLGYLHASGEARSIVTWWLGAVGLLGNVGELDELGLAMLNNIAPVSPEATLAAIERVLLKTDDAEVVRDCSRHVSLLRSLAYDAELFDRSIALILKIALIRDLNDNANEAAKVFASLFMIRLSGTHATVEQRLGVIKSLLESTDAKRRKLGSMALKAALEAWHFGSAYNFEFGARSRDYGYWPSSRGEVKRWFGSSLRFAQVIACSDTPAASEVRAAIAEQFRGLWTQAGMYEELEAVCRAISEKQFWTEGWIAVRQTIFYDSKGFGPEILSRVASLEALLRPSDLVQRVQSIVLSEAVIYIGVDANDYGDADVTKTMAEVETRAHELGSAVAADQDALAQLLPDLIGAKTPQLWSFGGGLADGAEEPGAIWGQLVACLGAMPPEKREPRVFCGFLNAIRATQPALVDDLLDRAMENEPLAPWYPILQAAVGIDKEGLNRLMRSLELRKAWVGTYYNLVGGGVTHRLCGSDFNKLLLRIAREPGGLHVAIDILCMRLSFDEGRRNSSPAELNDIGCELMRQLTFRERTNSVANHGLAVVASNCLGGENGAETVRGICSKLRDAVAKSETFAFYHDELLQVLLRVQPAAALQALCGDNGEDLTVGISILDQAGQLRRKAFDAIADTDLLSWCDQQPESRYPAAAAGVTAFQPSGDTGRPQWTGTARKLLDNAPDRVEVLRKFIEQFCPITGFGSQVAILELNTKLLDDLTGYADPALTEFIAKERTRLTEVIHTELYTDLALQRQMDERFE
jgi:hypothetical protein